MGDFIRNIFYELKNKRLSKAEAIELIRLHATEINMQEEAAAGTPAQPPVGSIMMVPVWDAVQVDKEKTFPDFAERIAIAGGSIDGRNTVKQYYPEAQVLGIQSGDSIETIAERIRICGWLDHIIWTVPYKNIKSTEDGALIEEQNNGVLQGFRIMKALLRLGYGSRNLGWTVITIQSQPMHKNDVVNPAHASIHGLMGSIAKEYPNWKVRLVDLEAKSDWPLSQIFALPTDSRGRAWVYRRNEWYRQQLIPIHEIQVEHTLYKTGGVYVVIGGAGNIGEVWSEYMIRTYQAQIVWIGRRELNEAISAKLDRLGALGPAPHYVMADAADKRALGQAYEEIKQKYPHINGVVHSAMAFSEQSLEDLEEMEFRSVLSAKVDVSVYLAQVFNKEPLDFILFFSSIIAFIKNVKQGHYASGCTFKDAFAHMLSQERKCKVKVMNWGYWSNAEIEAFKHQEQPEQSYLRLAQIGIGLIEPPEAAEALEMLLAGPVNQMALMKTTKPLAVEGMNIEETLAIYPEVLSSSIKNMKANIPAYGARVQAMKSNISLQRNEMYALLCKLLWVQLQVMGLFAQKEAAIDSLKTKAGLIDLYDRWLDESVAVLERNDYIYRNGNSWVVRDTAPVDRDGAWREWKEKKAVWLENPDMKSHVILVESVLLALPEILTGKVPATDIMFPHSSMEVVEGIYKNNAVSDYFNEVLADTAAAYIAKRLKHEPDAQVRILEIGAGTGGTSAMVFRKLYSLRAHIEEYCYTDISKAFLLHAEKEYGPNNPYLTYKIFDIEQPAALQGIDAGGYDIVIAANVLHATKNIRRTLRNAKAALKSKGLLLINEISGSALFTHLTFGLLEGWWLYEDSALRIPGCPGLSSETWREVLEKEGYGCAFFPAESAHEVFGQQIIAAESDGIVRQGKQLKPGVKFVNRSKVPKADVPQSTGRAQQWQIRKTQSTPLPVTKRIQENNSVTDPMVEEHVRRSIIEKLADSLKVGAELIEVDEPFSDYGLDSIMGVNLVQVINQALSIELQTTCLFEYSTVDQLTAHVLSQYKDIIASVLRQDERQKLSEGDRVPGIKEVLTVNPAPKRFLRKRMAVKPCGGEIEDSRREFTEKDDIAVIGMAGQFPDAEDTDIFWQNLMKGHDAVRRLPARYLEDAWDMGSTKIPVKDYYKWGGILEGRDCFDPLFFNISPKEAESMNPHQRLVLQESWKALEDAGYNPKKLSDSQMGVFIGAEPSRYFYESFTGSSDAIVASRLSYYLDLKGPAFVVNTGCSSSAAAIHLACESLKNNESSIALAGGVFANLSPSGLMVLADIGMLSPTGKCNTFDESADGTVLSEGVGVVVLKRLTEAVTHGDHIYGVIKGSGLNQDGASNGITAPNGVAQERLISSVYKRYNINPGDITYVEAHGTGTKLGDPIETNALIRAFKQFTDREGYCSIGSAKSYIGHTSAAAGVIGLIKILLSIRHNKIPGLINFTKLNPFIDFKGSAFYVSTGTSEWKSKNQKPLTAALNSFGHSGTNVHIVVQEYIPAAPMAIPAQAVRNEGGDVLIPLSARNRERLLDYAQKLQRYLEKTAQNENGLIGIASGSLQEIAYTLQTGREAMEERIVFLVKSIPELIAKLGMFLEGKEALENYWCGQVKQGKNTVSLFASDEEMQEVVQKWIARGKLKKIAELWTQGFPLEWEQLYEGKKIKRIPLPTYPFAKERYWVAEAGSREGCINTQAAANLHPLLHQNTSDLSEQRFTSTFTGQEFFLSDHVVKGQRMLPGVACLEMARAAVEQAAGVLADNRPGIQLKNIIWARPIVVEDKPVRVHIGLYPEENGDIAYEIYSDPQEVDAEPTVHSQGAVLLNTAVEAQALDIIGVREQCSKSSITAGQCYEAFKGAGIEYGPGHRGIEEIYVGDGQVLAKLTLPADVSSTREQYILHPSIMDSALQALIGLALGGNAADSGKAVLKPYLPFALQQLDIFRECASAMWVHVRYSEGSKAEDKLQKLDINLCDQHGNISVHMKGFSSRALEEEAGFPDVPGNFMLEPSWIEKPVIKGTAAAGYAKHLVILCELDSEALTDMENIKTGMDGVHCITLQSERKGIDERFKDYAIGVFEEIQNILADKSKDRVLVQIIVPANNKQQLFAALSGLLKTAQLENPKLTGQLIEIAPEDRKEIVEKLQENSRCPGDGRIRYQKGKRHVALWSEMKASLEESIPWKDNGSYLITGGAGGLGLIFAGEIAWRVKNAALILTGRSPLDSEKQAMLEELRNLGARVQYKQVDVTQKQAVTSLMNDIKEEHGTLNGIIHSAGVIRDSYLLRKTREEIREVLAPKVAGLVNLDEASKELVTDFFILFSSASAVLGNPGQADYALANAFMDSYAGYRNSLVALQQRQGRTLSVNWPLWKEGGMQVDPETKNGMLQNLGMSAMQTSTGIQALYRGLASGGSQVMVMEGDLKRLKSVLLGQRHESEIIKAEDAPVDNQMVPPVVQDVFREKAINYFKRLLSSVIKLPAGQIDADANMEKYGIDSIMVMKLTNHLEKTFGSLSKTLFFEYQNIRALTDYFLEAHRDRLTVLIGIEEKAERTVPEGNKPKALAEPTKSPVISRKRPRFAVIRTGAEESKEKKALDIAVIGMSGRYPQAGNLEEFWKNLRDGKDCITEIPKERWDYSLYFDEDKDKFGKVCSKWGGFIDNVDRFDPLFFNISPREAEIMDPQERLFLQCVYETMEDAGYTRETIGGYQGSGVEGNVGVFVGVMYEEYQLYGLQEQLRGVPIAFPGNPSSIANRVSYFCNFHGPSMAVDTMCSSSLTSIHLACQSIQRGECELAVAGGVNISIHPNKYLMLGQGKFASSKGRCESFGQGGDGYVPGEGVGAVLLKPLSKAVADGDQIYGIIKGTAINHGGKTNGYTVPNPNAQAAVIEQAFKGAGIDPETISYIEAHGTGTSLGDPIEITGLSKAFQKYTQSKQFCVIGSAKSNIGHCESAAGIAGVTKVLLQMKHRQLVPSLHSKVLNPNIDFINTPFVVSQELTQWKRPVIEGVEIPRRAGISSFGAGGANAHVVIEEYVPENRERPSMMITARNPAIIVLSAKDEERLKEQAQQLLAAVENGLYTDACLADMAYTLQIGREAMEERLGLIVLSIKELQEKLRGFVEGQDGIEDLYRGQGKRNRETMAVLSLDEDMQKMLDAWVKKEKYGKLLDLWVKGLDFDWNRMHGVSRPQKISLPTYPFARERYWIPEIDTGSIAGTTPPSAISYLHPLLHQNISGLSGLLFSSTFTGKEFFLADHVVKGRKIMPGVACIEMMRAALEQVTGTFKEGAAGIRFRDVLWIRPIVVDEEPINIHIGIYHEDEGGISYKIYSGYEATDTEPVVHSQGRGEFFTAAEVPALDIKALQAECSCEILLPDRCYAAFEGLGIHYGLAHRGIDKVYVGQGKVLAKISLPSNVSDTLDDYVLHPSLMDAALQASIGLMTGSDKHTLMLPFALETLEIHERCTREMWALIRYSEGSKAGNEVQKLDIDLCDPVGRLCVRIKGFSSRALEEDIQSVSVPGKISLDAGVQPLVGSFMLVPVWDPVKVERVQDFPSSMDEVVIIGGTEAETTVVRQLYPEARVLELQSGDTEGEIAQKLKTCGFMDHIVWIAPHGDLKAFADDALIENQEEGVFKVFRTIKALLGLGYGDRELGWTIITTQAQAVRENDLTDPTHASLHGLAGSMAKEYPYWKIRLVDLEAGCEWPVADIFTIQANSQGDALAYRGKEWYQQQMLPFRPSSVGQTLYRPDGVYVVIGGAGGIGEAWSEYMIRTYRAKIVWIGRRQVDTVMQAKLDRLAALGTAPVYIAADATNRESLQKAYETVKSLYSRINGVIHSAIVLQDQSLAKMDEERLRAGLSAKVDVSVRMAQVFSKEELDFVMFFSSMQSFIKAPGQSNYASGCTFKDAFARRLSKDWNCAVKVMNWGYWGNVGIVASQGYQDRMAQAGLGSIEPSEAMEALEKLLAGTIDQIMFVKTTKPLEMKGIRLEEFITVYPEERPLNIRNIQSRISMAAEATDALEAYCLKAGINIDGMK